MNKPMNDQYYKGYIAGYRDGVANTISGHATPIDENNLALLPVKAMAISARAHNCLLRAGCTYIADVVNISDYTICHMRNMGNKTAAEIARWLDDHGFPFTAWTAYL